jgi:hypothetical protein
MLKADCDLMLKLNNFSYHYRILFQISPVEAETMVDTENQPAVANGGGGNGDAASPLEKKIIRQIEYYFGDYNLPRDKFLQVGSSTNFAGFALVSWGNEVFFLHCITPLRSVFVTYISRHYGLYVYLIGSRILGDAVFDYYM